MTHGWNSDPGVWASGMASNLQIVLGSTVNIAAWDWQEAAHTGIQLSKAFYRTPKQGKALGRRIAADLPSGSRPPLHFIGHSLGALVNAAAADYLHDKADPPFDWQKSHMTLLDNAALANVEGALVSSGFNPKAATATLALELLAGGIVWHTPDQAAWIDNYISLVGQYSTMAVNVVLEGGPLYLAREGELGLNPIDNLTALHGYACGWYTKSVARPNESPLGHRYPFEKLGNSPGWPTPSPYGRGSLLVQTSPTAELALAPVQQVVADLAEEVARRVAKASQQVFDRVVNTVGHTVEAAGEVLVDVVDEVAEGVSDAWGWGVKLTTKAIDIFPPLGDVRAAAPATPTNSPAYARMTVAVPTNAATLTFTFSLEGEGQADSFVFGINGTNLLTLETEFMPQGAPVPSGPIDVTAWKGQNVELEFGIAGGTSTNASITVKHLHFNTLTAPALKVARGDNGLLLSWPITATGYGLESAPVLGTTNQWTSVTNAPGILGFQQAVTNSLSATNEFFRLRRL
jgi:hypothetical protein